MPVIVEAMIQTVLLDWRGVLRDGKPLPFTTDNARRLLLECDDLRDRISEKAMQLQDDSQSGIMVSPGADDNVARPKPTIIDTTALTPDERSFDKKPTLAELRIRRNENHSTVPAIQTPFRLPPTNLLNEANPQETVDTVALRPILETSDWATAEARFKMPFVLGRDVSNQPVIADLTDLQHVLMAGTTGTGKSACIDAIVTSLLFTLTPEQVRFVMFDLRQAQLKMYASLPHLVIPIVTERQRVLLAFRWLMNEAHKRYRIFAEVGVRDIGAFNNRMCVAGSAPPVQTDDMQIPEQMPFIVIVIDELAEVLRAADEVETAITSLTENGRAAGIHL
ncbi:MAG: hypothetical protein H0W34_11125, partial [Pyrinomonadaceae bacterium]|nr:hypothetical protein [Pyrinomonadaceae bacterium]